MSAPIALGAAVLPSFDHNEKRGNALTGRTTPNNVLPQVDRSKVDPQTLRAVEGMEAMFLDYMMKVMRQTVPKNDMDLSSPATEIYQGMVDTETAQKAARTGGIGLADQILAYLEAQRYTDRTGQRTAPVDREGTRPVSHNSGGAREN